VTRADAPYLRCRRIIAFTGPIGAGKSTAARHLVEAHGFARVRFAGPLKAMLAALGLTPDEIEGRRKECPSGLLCGKTPRWAMQTLGTEWGRDLIGPDLWVRAWKAALPAGDVTVDDCRFPNENVAIDAEGGIVVRIERRVAAVAAAHVSESNQRLLPASYTIINDGTVHDLHRRLDAMIAQYQELRAA
jgi:hypothetical protein